MKDKIMTQTPTPIDDETLMAFADGQLDEPMFSTVADALEADADLAARLDGLVQGGALARAGYASLLAPVPDALEAAVRRSVATAERRRLWQKLFDMLRLPPLGAMAVAASIALVALPAGFFLGQAGQSASTTQVLAQPAIASALDNLLSGESAPLPDGGQITAIATFTDAGGAVCREFETSGADSHLAIACRLGGQWQTQFAMAQAGDDAQAYRPASGADIVDTVLEAMGAGAPLLDAEERNALRRADD